MSKKRFKQYLMLLTVIGLVAIAAGGGGTFASFTAETANSGNTFATGNLILNNTVNGGTTCISANGGVDTNVNTACTKVFNVTVKKPGDSYIGDQIDLSNSGDITPTALTLLAGACADGSAAGETYHGSGSLCGSLDVYVQEWTTNSYATPKQCWYGGNVGVGNACSFDDTKTLATLHSAGAQTLSGGLAPSTDRYFTIGVELPSSATNTVQGLAATADLTWQIQ